MRSKVINVRLEESMVEEIERLRDVKRFPTQSDFVREAIRRLVREEQRDLRRREVKLIAQDREEMERTAALAEAEFPDLAERWARADRGDV